MRVKHHFCCDSGRSLTDALERNGIPYEHDTWGGIRQETVTFDLYEDSAAFGEITALAGSGDVQSREYTKQELLDPNGSRCTAFIPRWSWYARRRPSPFRSLSVTENTGTESWSAPLSI